jgi:hypothetical protein
VVAELKEVLIKMGYAIICDARIKTDNIKVLVLVDRRKTKKQWWTEDKTHLMMVYDKYPAANFVANRLKYNNAKVISAEKATSLIEEQSKKIEMEESLDKLEEGWDGHKEWIS